MIKGKGIFTQKTEILFGRLDELKRVELQRLRELTEKKMKLEQGIDEEHHHVDQTNPHTFEIEDLKKLITKTTQVW